MSDFKPGSLSEQLETLLDGNGLLAVVKALECLCGDKAEHLRVNWQDTASAREWDKAGKALTSAARTISNLSLPSV